MKERTIAILHTTPRAQRQLMWLLVALILCTLSIYGYFLRIAIGATVERGNILHAIEAMNANIAELDASYVALEKDITLARAIAMGYHEVADPAYLTVADTKPTLGLRGRDGI